MRPLRPPFLECRSAPSAQARSWCAGRLLRASLSFLCCAMAAQCAWRCACHCGVPKGSGDRRALLRPELATAELNALRGHHRPALRSADDRRIRAIDRHRRHTHGTDRWRRDRRARGHAHQFGASANHGLGGRGGCPYVYTCLYEGGESTPGLYAIGETAERQLRPSIAWLGNAPSAQALDAGRQRLRLATCLARDRAQMRRRIAWRGGRRSLRALRGRRLFAGFRTPCAKTAATRCWCRFVGQDAVEFNRAFASAGLQRHVLRLSCAIEENQLLAIGADCSEDLHVALGYFAALDTDANGSFKERYHGRFGARAPTLEFDRRVALRGPCTSSLRCSRMPKARGGGNPTRARGPLAYPSARGALHVGGGVNHAPMHLARAEGHLFKVSRTAVKRKPSLAPAVLFFLGK